MMRRHSILPHFVSITQVDKSHFSILTTHGQINEQKTATSILPFPWELSRIYFDNHIYLKKSHMYFTLKMGSSLHFSDSDLLKSKPKTKPVMTSDKNKRSRIDK